jgi:2-alkyl-3-oxoalkanoate reductase
LPLRRGDEPANPTVELSRTQHILGFWLSEPVRIFVAGASGAIGQPLIAELIRNGHTVTGMTRSENGARRLNEQGAAAEIANAFDASAVEHALRRSESEIDELTALPQHPADMSRYSPGDRDLRLTRGGNLHRAAEICGVRRYVQQASGFLAKAGDRLADESEALAVDASPEIAASAKMYDLLEARTLGSQTMEGIVLRYGFFYGPNTWYHPNGGAGDQVRRRRFPLVGQAQGVWSFVHIEDPALATAAAVTAEPGVYNVVDDDPSPVSRWLPRFAHWVGAPPPRHIPELVARIVAGKNAVYYSTKLRGSSNEKAQKILSSSPRPLQWLRD